jgi:membrane-associated phospholipid phosphatase
MLEAIEKIIDIIGYFGPQILILLTIFLLFNKYTLLQIYLIGFVINSFLNFVLKGIIKQPRPSEDKHVFNVWLNNGMKGDRLWFDRFGMPSGHAQSVFYSTFFIIFALQNTNINILYLIISLNTLYQRVKYKNHTVLQVIVGAIVGTIIGSLLYYYSQKILQGKLKEKEDDNAPI